MAQNSKINQGTRTQSNGSLETLSCGIDQVDSGLVHVADRNCLVQICMEPILVHRDVQVDNIPILERTLVRNAMADDFVDRCAARLFESIVVQR